MEFRVKGFSLDPIPAPKDKAAPVDVAAGEQGAAPVDAVDGAPKDGAAPVDVAAHTKLPNSPAAAPVDAVDAPPVAAPVDAVDAPPKDGAAPVDAGAELSNIAAKKLAHILTWSPSRRGDCAYIRR